MNAATERKTPQQPYIPPGSVTYTRPLPGTESLRFRVSQGCMAEVAFDGPVTQRAIDKLIKQLELVKDDYPELVPTETPT